ncbi:hypothetical protein KBY83_12050 [Cyanobium sp. WKJ7-Wakatipu]|uniref:hypothetical protein n=1 Tax=Cyanobium sp. WKJ7-Wakatipu TaxID=2823726 RepID=UPI0020CC5200|nr:hypothetical protein [Cyanobium sp. WKJ7-Wakatipu]MCP9784036.1 hypothetical protein [Cyanobium sp. WKJ7-Wakatipu]
MTLELIRKAMRRHRFKTSDLAEVLDIETDNAYKILTGTIHLTDASFKAIVNYIGSDAAGPAPTLEVADAPPPALTITLPLTEGEAKCFKRLAADLEKTPEELVAMLKGVLFWRTSPSAVRERFLGMLGQGPFTPSGAKRRESAALIKKNGKTVLVVPPEQHPGEAAA